MHTVTDDFEALWLDIIIKGAYPKSLRMDTGHIGVSC